VSWPSPGWPFHQPDGPGSGTKLLETTSRSRHGFHPARLWEPGPVERFLPAAITLEESSRKTRNHWPPSTPGIPKPLGGSMPETTETPVKPGACQIPAQSRKSILGKAYSEKHTME